MSEEKAKETKTVSVEEHEATVKELEEAKKAYSNLANAFNKLLKEYNEMHVAMLFKEQPEGKL